MDIFLPVADMTASLPLILGLGLVAGILSGIFGIGGGFLTGPSMLFMGVPPLVMVATQSAQLFASSLSGTYYNLRKGKVDKQLGFTMLAGGVFGTLVGLWLAHLIERAGLSDLVVPMLFIAILGFIGISTLYKTYKQIVLHRKEGVIPEPGPRSTFVTWPLQKTYAVSGITTSTLAPAAIGFGGGLLVSIMGVGGGFILVPAMVFLLGVQTHQAVATSLFQIVFTSLLALTLHAGIGGTVDPVLAALLVTGSIVGAQIGARLAQRLKGASIQVMLGVLVLSMAGKLAYDLIIRLAGG